MNESPYSDDVFGTSKEVPYSDDIFKSAPKEPKSWAGSLNDALFSSSGTSFGRVMSAIGQGAEDNWGQMVHYSQDTQEWLKQQGLYNDHSKGQNNIIKAVNEAWIRPAVNTAFGAAAIVTSGLAGLTEGTGQYGNEMVKQAQESNKHPQGLDAVIGFSPGNWLEGATGEYLEGLASGFIPEMGIPHSVAKARAVGAIGETTEKFLGTEPLTEKDIQARAKATGALPDKPAPQPSIHDIARSIAPDVFYDKDILDTKNDLLKKEIERTTKARNEDPKVKAAQDEIDTILNKVKGNEEKLTKKQASRLAEIKGDLETFLDTDTPEMITAKEAHLKNYQALLDISADVRTAYKEAGAKLAEEPLELNNEVLPDKGEPELHPTASDRIGADNEFQRPEESLKDRTIKAYVESGIPEAEARKAVEDALAKREVAKQSVKNQAQTYLGELAEDNHIRDDASTKLKTAGRPVEEANLLGQLIQSRYRSRAARFKGKLGTAKELYDREFKLEAQDAQIGAKGELGSLTVKDGQKTLKLFKSADPSTVIHELGHQNLEDLLQDAAHPEAPADLVKDAQAVKDYLGIKEGKKPSRKQHEQFARTFERYLMEGTAPTQELLNVFRQFKQWLTELYHSVANLAAPINNDIRSVFDRLLTYKEDPLLIPEGEIPTSVSPQSKMLREISEEGSTTEGTPKTSTEPIVDNNTEYLQKDGKFNFENIQSYGQLIEATKQFSEMHDLALKAKKGKISDAEVAEAAENAGLATSEINREKLESVSTEDGLTLASRIYGLNEYFKQNARVIHELLQRNEISDDDMIRFAEAISRHRKAAEVLLGIRGEWGRAGRALNEILSQRINEGELSDMLRTNIGITYHQLRAAMQQGKLLVTNTKQVSQMVTNLAKPSRGQLLFQYLINGYISGPITHAVYSIGNKLTLMYRLFGEAPTEALISSLKQSVSSAPLERVTWGEVRDGIHAMWFGTSDGWRAMKAAVKAGQQQGLQSEDLIANRVKHEVSTGRISQANQLTRANELIKKIEDFHQAFDFRDIAKDELRVAAGKPPRIPAHLNEIFDIIAKTEPPQSYYNSAHMATPQGALGKFITAPGKYLVSPIHSMDYTMSFVVEQERLVSRQARLEGERNGWNKQQVALRMAELKNNTPLGIVKEAKSFALNTTLMNTGNYNSWLSKFKRTMHHEFDWSYVGMGPTPALSVVQPFVSITSNVLTGALRQTFKNNVTGILFRDVQKDLMGKNGSLAQTRTMAKMSLGTAFFGSIWGLCEQGIINPPASDNVGERIINEMSDGVPNGVRIGEMSYDLEKLGPLGLSIALISEMHHAKDKWAEDGFTEAAGSLIYGVGHQVSQVGPISGVSDFFDSISQGGKYAENYVNGIIETLAEPAAVGMSQIAKQIDPYQREISIGNRVGLKDSPDNKGLMPAIAAEWDNLKKGWMSHTPIASTYLTPKIDLFGQPIPNKEFWGVYAEKISNDPIYKAFKDAKYFPSKVSKEINGYELSDVQYEQYARKAGITLYQLVGNIVNSASFASMPAVIRHDMISKAVQQARAQAKLAVSIEHHEIPQFSVHMQQMIAAGTEGTGDADEKENISKTLF